MVGIFRNDNDGEGWQLVATANSPELARVIVVALAQVFVLASFDFRTTYADQGE